MSLDPCEDLLYGDREQINHGPPRQHRQPTVHTGSLPYIWTGVAHGDVVDSKLVHLRSPWGKFSNDPDSSHNGVGLNNQHKSIF